MECIVGFQAHDCLKIVIIFCDNNEFFLNILQCWWKMVAIFDGHTSANDRQNRDAFQVRIFAFSLQIEIEKKLNNDL